MTYEKLIRYYKNDKLKAAYALRVTVGTVYNWAKRGIPISSQQKIEIMTGGKLKADKI